MADLETTHRVLEKIEVAGNQKAEKAYTGIAKAAQMLGQKLGLVDEKQEGVESVADALAEAGDAAEKAGKGGGEGGKGFAELVLGMTTAELVSKGLEKALGWVIDKLAALWDRLVKVGEESDKLQRHLQAVAHSTLAFGKGETGSDHLQKSMKVAGALLQEFREEAVRTGQPVEKIAEAYEKANVPLTALKKSQADVLKFTKGAAATAKVYGKDMGEVTDIAAEFIKTGQIDRSDPFSFRLYKESAVGFFSTAQGRAKKVQAALEKMGAPVKEVTRNTEDATTRWTALVDDVLAGAAVPIYQKIGGLLSDIVDWTEKHKKGIEDVVGDVEEWVETIWSVGSGVWSTVTALDDVLGVTSQVGDRLALVWDILKVIGHVVDAIGLSFQVVGESIKVLIDPSRGMGKLDALTEGFKLKWLEVVGAINRVVTALAKIVIPEWVQDKVPWAKDFVDGLKATDAMLDKQVEAQAKNVRALEKKAGIGGTTAATRALANKEQGIGLSKEERAKLLGQAFGQKRPLINIENVTINQDFRETDPDAVAIEMVQTFEKLSQNAVQSTVGGGATVHGGS